MNGLKLIRIRKSSDYSCVSLNKNTSSKGIMHTKFLAALWVLLVTLPAISLASAPLNDGIILTADISETEPTRFDALATKQLMQKALRTFYTPGMSVGVVHKGKLIFLESAGLRNIADNSRVTPETYFRLASTSKAFTAAAIGILVDQGKLTWTDKVTQYLPNFQMQDAWVTREFTIKDLLVHHSGLVSGAGDSMIWPEPSGFSRSEVIHNLRYLTPQTSFRSQYAYSNVLYISAGEIIAKVSGMSYGDFVEKFIFNPLDMTCFAGDIPAKKLNNTAMSYAHNDEKGVYAIPRNSIQQAQQMSVAAGGIVCNAKSMSNWVKAHLAPDTLPFSRDVLDALWSPNTILDVSDSEEALDGTLFNTYGYGWRIADMHGYKLVSHTGTLSGYQAYVALLPELEVGVVVLNNGSNYGARSSVMQHILKSFIPIQRLPDTTPNDWVQAFFDLQAEQEAEYFANYQPVPEPSLPMRVSQQQLIGNYQDTWFGSMKITAPETAKGRLNEGTLRIESERMITLKGSVTPYEGNRFKVEWDNKNAASDAFLIIETNFKNEVTGLKMHPFVAAEKERHEYRDMHFLKQ
ncbi:serine hydrolase [Brumicola nitratireducens]|uniref:Putative beta-lactamase, penicillin-binding protein n=1 Tax=Glaciecola nitratireducens (strain JCM 12485 / KCTC 12276 / FR1064) TaxID=1085623 RepID=G4QI70_GLANF|nr:serine hydrolase [Glaciecola nitratireducens]AEP30684.1 putative beta-lactamase, penicillin-binding protein [Glaciecola nitratireducens FR1064]